MIPAPIKMYEVFGPATLAAAAVLAWLLITTAYWLMIARDCPQFTAQKSVA